MANQQLGFDVVGKSNATEVMGKAGKEADKLAKKLKNAFDLKGALTSAFIGAFGAAALLDKAITSVTEGISRMSQANQESKKAGMDPSEFDKLAIVSEKAGVSMLSLGKAIRQLKIGMKDALTDTSEMTKFTKGLGFAEEDLRNGKVKTIDVVTRIAQVIASQENETKKLAIATAFLSEKFANELLPTLEKIGNDPDIFKGLNTASDVAYEKADRVYEKWSRIWQMVSQSLAVGTMDFLENPLGRSAGGRMSDGERETRRKEFEFHKKRLAEPDPKAEEASQAIIDADKKSKKNDNTIASSSGPSAINGPTSGVIGVGNNATNLIMEEQLDTLKQIKEAIDRLGTPGYMNTDFTKQQYPTV
jgi:hypothetical protein